MIRQLTKLSTGRLIALGFLAIIFLGSLLLMLPIAVHPGITLHYIDALYTSVSAVCVTGLVSVDVADTFSVFGQVVVALLIQIGGLGVATLGTGIMVIMGRRIHMKGRSMVREAMNTGSGSGLVRLVRWIFFTTVTIEFFGAVLSFFVFIQDYSPLDAVGLSLFHSIAAFNNSGFDLFGSFRSLTAYQDNVPLLLITAALIILGGIGFLLMHEVRKKGLHWKKYSMHARVVLSTTAALLVVGTLLLKCTEELSWAGAFFMSVSTRTAGFAIRGLNTFTSAGLLLICVLMVIGASPGSTGGGVKTTTFFVLLRGVDSAATNRSEQAFHYSIPKDAFRKAAVITSLALGVILSGTYLMMLMDPQVALRDALVEVCSAFGTVGLSTGITPSLSAGSKILSMLIMYTGRLGPLTIASLWYFSRGELARYPQGDIAIG